MGRILILPSAGLPPTIVGYSAPTADVEAKRVMKEGWHANPSRELAQVSIVDVKKEEEVTETWRPFFVRNHYGVSPSLDHSYLFTHPRRTCDAFAMATLQLSPCRSNPLPITTDLGELQSFASSLIAEEDTLETLGTAFEC